MKTTQNSRAIRGEDGKRLSAGQRQHAALLAAQGATPGRTCGECLHRSLRHRGGSRGIAIAYPVCMKAPTRSDIRGVHRAKWNRDWTACGLFLDASLV